MARYSPGYKDQTRDRILAAAGRLFRGEGYAASGVAKVMAAVDLTVGGFYGHFESKEALLAEVLARSVEETRNVLLAGLDEVTGFPFVRELARRYLSRVHRDAREDGCALPALVAEIGRQSEPTREVFEEYLRALWSEFEDHLPDEPRSKLTRRDRALALTALFIGGVALARAVKSPELSDRILLACKRFATVEDRP